MNKKDQLNQSPKQIKCNKHIFKKLFTRNQTNKISVYRRNNGIKRKTKCQKV